MKKVFLIIGESGSGKTSIVEKLEKRGYKALQSYTTRPPRTPGERGHKFCSIEEYTQQEKTGNIVAYTFFDGHHYFCTKSQLFHCDLYVIDPDGVKYLKGSVVGVDFITIYIKVDLHTRKKRMDDERGLNESFRRIVNDKKKFNDADVLKIFNYVVPNYDLEKAVAIVESIIINENQAGVCIEK